MRRMGGLKKYLPVTYFTMLIGTLAISGFPPFAGFFSKDEILITAMQQNMVVFVLLSLTSVLTAAYMFRMLFMTFHGAFRGTKDQEHHLHESPPSMTGPLIILAVLSALGGFLGLPALFGEGRHALHNFLEPVFGQNSRLVTEEPSKTSEIILILASVAILGWVVKMAFDRYDKKQVKKDLPEEDMKWPYRLSYRKFYLDEFYDAVIVHPLEKLSAAFHTYIEKGLIDKMVDGTGTGMIRLSGLLRRIQTGNIGFYVWMMVLGLAAMIFYGVIRMM